MCYYKAFQVTCRNTLDCLHARGNLSHICRGNQEGSFGFFVETTLHSCCCFISCFEKETGSLLQCSTTLVSQQSRSHVRREGAHKMEKRWRGPSDRGSIEDPDTFLPSLLFLGLQGVSRKITNAMTLGSERNSAKKFFSSN